MKKISLAILCFLGLISSYAQESPFPEGTKPASTNIIGSEYPRIDAERKAYFKISSRCLLSPVICHCPREIGILPIAFN